MGFMAEQRDVAQLMVAMQRYIYSWENIFARQVPDGRPELSFQSTDGRPSTFVVIRWKEGGEVDEVEDCGVSRQGVVVHYSTRIVACGSQVSRQTLAYRTAAAYHLEI